MALKTYHEGREARLFPAVKSGEDRATSIFLAVLDSVKPFRVAMMQSIEVNVRKRGTKFISRVHPEFATKNISKDIPDGMLSLRRKLLLSKELVRVEK